MRFTRLAGGSGGGCILALTWPHLVLDGASEALFINDWAAIYRQLCGQGELAVCLAPELSNSWSAAARVTGAAKRGIAAAAAESSCQTRVACGEQPSQPSSSPSSSDALNFRPREFSRRLFDEFLAAAPQADDEQQPQQQPCYSRGAASSQASDSGSAPAGASVTLSVGAGRSGSGVGPQHFQGAQQLQQKTTHDAAASGKGRTFFAGSVKKRPQEAAKPAPATASLSGATSIFKSPLGSIPAPGLGRAAAALGSMCRALREENARFPGSLSNMKSELLHIPEAAATRLKQLAMAGCATGGGAALASGGAGVANNLSGAGSSQTPQLSISMNDALSSFFWVLCCDLRGRPLPGHRPEASAADGAAAGSEPEVPNCFGMAVDLRQNGLQGRLPADYFGNASWLLTVRSSGSATTAAAVTAASAAPAAAAAEPPIRETDAEPHVGASTAADDIKDGGGSCGTVSPPSRQASAALSTLTQRSVDLVAPASQPALGTDGGLTADGSSADFDNSSVSLPPEASAEQPRAVMAAAEGHEQQSTAAAAEGKQAAAAFSVARMSAAVDQHLNSRAQPSHGAQHQCYVDALCCGAAKVREAVVAFRANPASGCKVLALSRAQNLAPRTSQVQIVASTMLAYDAMLTSWRFPYFDADFGSGGSSNAPVFYQGFVHPSPPWSAALMRAHPRHGGYYLAMNLPSSAVGALKRSAVLKALLPDAVLASDAPDGLK